MKKDHKSEAARLRQKTEEMLLKSEALYQSYLLASPDVIAITDLEGGIQFTSFNAMAMFGYERGEQPTTRNVIEFLCPEDRQRAESEILRMYQGILTGPVEYRGIRSNGSMIDVEVNGELIRNKEGEPTGVIYIIRDITQRKEVEKNLRNSEDRYRSIFQGSADGIMIADEENQNILFANSAQCQMFGYTEEQFKTRNISEIHPKDTFHYTLAEFARQARGEKTFAENIQCLKKNGEIFYADINSSIISLNGRKHMMGFFRDITGRKRNEDEIRNLNATLELKIVERTAQLTETNENLQKEIEERKHADEALLENEAKYRTLIESTGTGYLILDWKGLVIDANSEYVRMSGHKELSEILGKSVMEWTAEYEKQKNMEAVDRCAREGQIRNLEIDYVDNNGRVTPVEINATFEGKGEEARIISICRDITERKHAEEEIRKARNEADKANHAKSEFLSRMSHELRTPMNSILGFAQLMDIGELNPAHKKGINHILNSGQHLLQLINEVLDISSIEAGRISISLEPVQLDGVIMEMIDVVYPNAAKRNQTLELVNSPANKLFVKADNKHLKQVLLNLLSNSIKYNRENGSVVIRTELMQKENQETSLVRISVSDTGIGINSEDISKLFLPFERIGAEKTETEGTGLGLTVIKKLMGVMGGNVGVESIPGEGSTFWIELPLVENLKRQYVRTGDAALPETTVTERTGTILYIEDNISSVDLVEEIIETHRPAIRFLTSKFGKLAVKSATDYLPDLIFLGLDLPDIHGSKVLSNLLSDAKTRSIPVVILTADAMPQQIEKLMNAGARDYLTKPIDVMMFLQVVDEWIGGEK